LGLVSPNTSKGKEEMKSYRNALAALLLAFAFSMPAFAEGIIHTEKTPPPPPQQQQQQQQTEGIIHTETAPSTPEEDMLTEIVLNLLQTLIPLL
jgi:hypothetical protein